MVDNRGRLCVCDLFLDDDRLLLDDDGFLIYDRSGRVHHGGRRVDHGRRVHYGRWRDHDPRGIVMTDPIGPNVVARILSSVGPGAHVRGAVSP